jgi:uncharacterized tellurite resistance protein B-like protein
MESLQIARILAAALWADGTVHPKEAEAFRRYLERARDLSRDAKLATMALVDTRPDVDLAEARQLSADARRRVLEEVQFALAIDGSVSPEEAEWLTKLRAQLDLRG